eukprot:2567974-Heterocapsa_arctica.AAC.1
MAFTCVIPIPFETVSCCGSRAHSASQTKCSLDACRAFRSRLWLLCRGQKDAERCGVAIRGLAQEAGANDALTRATIYIACA